MRSKKGVFTKSVQDKTIVVTVYTYKNHPKYRKRFRTSKKYQVHNPENKKFEEGESITFYETRPLSKLKKWTIETPTNTKTD
ncbi:MAG: 30S ribosomal protein S17 [Candidatus Gracilibacteria bacterium]|nr:30S ribosomal protein S17 [Candidatus Gracilibacteria bacterium]